MEKQLAQMKCEACQPGAAPVTEQDLAEYVRQLPDWVVVERDAVNRLERVYKFKNFVSALAFTNKVGALAEEQGHHPAILTEWGSVVVAWWTHAIGGLHQNDFVMAAKTDQLYTESQQ